MTTTGSARGGLGPTAEESFLTRDLPRLVGARRAQRIVRYQRAGVPLLVIDVNVRQVEDERVSGGRPLWRAADGLIFERASQHPEAGRPDAVALEYDDEQTVIGVVELVAIDARTYRLAVEDHRAELERAAAEDAAALEAARLARLAAPGRTVTARGPWSLPELLERVEATAGTLMLHDDRVLVLLPSAPHLLGIEAQYAAAVEVLRPLLVATRLGTVTVECDVPDCHGDAERVGCGGAFLCADHA
jgi:hypothetical protein